MKVFLLTPRQTAIMLAALEGFREQTQEMADKLDPFGRKEERDLLHRTREHLLDIDKTIDRVTKQMESAAFK